MRRSTDTLVYDQNLSKDDLAKVIKSVGIPLAVFGAGLFTISSFAAFGTKLICPLSGAMWIVGFITALIMPSMRQEVISQTLRMNGIYYAALLGLKVLLGVVSGVSSEMISASYNQAIPTATGNAIPGYLQTMMWFTAVGIPIAFITMQAKRLVQFKRTQSLQKTFGRVRDIRNAGKEHMRHF